MDYSVEEIKILTTNINLTENELYTLKNILENKVEKYSLNCSEEAFINSFLGMFD